MNTMVKVGLGVVLTAVILKLVRGARAASPIASGFIGVALHGLDGDWRKFYPPSTGHPIYGTHYISPNTAELDYFKSKGMRVFRIGMRWETCQHHLYGPMDDVDPSRPATQLSDVILIDDLADDAAARGLQLILTPLQNYVGYTAPDGSVKGTIGYYDMYGGQGYTLGSSSCPYAAFADFWGRMAEHYRGHPGIWGYALCNEPSTISGQAWKEAAQAAIYAIREVDPNTRIIVNGVRWGEAQCWLKWGGFEPESDILKDLVDPGNNLLYEAHQYLDNVGSGDYESDDCSVVPVTRGQDRVSVFVNWLRANGKKGIIGEMGTIYDPCWLNVFDYAMAYIVQCGDVLKSFQYHAAGPWWTTNHMSLEPIKQPDGTLADRPPMAILEKYL